MENTKATLMKLMTKEYDEALNYTRNHDLTETHALLPHIIAARLEVISLHEKIDKLTDIVKKLEPCVGPAFA